MDHLSGLDATFLHLESPEMPMHVGSLCVLDLPEGFASDDFFEHAKQRVAERMHLADLFTRKLALIPFDLSNPVWVQDEDMDLDYHVRHITLPKPGSNRQLQQYVARLHSSLLDRSRPLWEFFIIDGLKSGQVALYTKAHHAGMDGQAGIAVAQAIFDLEPTGRVVKPPRPRVRRHQYQLGMAELGGAALRNTAQQFVKLFQTAPTILRALRDTVVPAPDENGKRHWGMPKSIKLFGPRTLLNVSVTNQRTFAGRTIPMAETKFIGKTLGGSLNDVVMCTTAGALRRYLKAHNNLPLKTLLAAVPVSLREAGDASANNQVSMMTMTLATDIADPVLRLLAINKASEASKAMMGRVKTAIPTDFPLFGAPWLMSGVAAIASRSGILNALPPIANLVISNVPGSPVPLYFAGAKLASFYPVSIVVHSMALNVTVQSYAGRLDYGLIACRRAVPDITDLGDYLLAEHQTLLERAQAVASASVQAQVHEVVAKTTAAPKPRAKRAAPVKTKVRSKLKLVSTKAAPARAKRPAAKRLRTA
jgi:diacylglycerol O-acyltransferase / wax synthase